MKNPNHQQHDALKGFYVQDSETENEKIQLRGRKKNGLKRPAARKAARKTTASATESMPRSKAPKNTTVRKSVARFMHEGNLFKDTLNEMPFGHDDYQLRQEMEIDRFSDEDVTSAFAVDAVRSLPIELEEGEVQGTYSDQQLVREIRRAVERDSAVSSTAQKIQLTAKNGVVILKGTVGSEQEQMIIEDKAVALAGFGQVVNQLEVIEDIIE
jgi:osmotically-inducible protein OsmY